MADDSAKPKKKGGKLKLVVIGLAGIALLGGGGAAAGMYFAGGKAKPAVDPNLPKLVERKEGGEGGEPWHGAGPDPRKYQASYYTFEQNFTSNLKDSDYFVQIGLGASTFYDHKVLDRLKDDEMPIRSAVLATLADADADQINSAAGRKALQGKLRAAINDVLVAHEGFGGVADVYFTSFVVQ